MKKDESEYLRVIEVFKPIIENLIRKYKNLIYLDTDDIRQELYIKVMVVYKDKQELLGEKVYPYITTSLKNLVLDMIRESTRKNIEVVYDDMIKVSNNKLDVRKPLREVMEGLSEQEMKIALLYMDGLYQDEIRKNTRHVSIHH